MLPESDSSKATSIHLLLLRFVLVFQREKRTHTNKFSKLSFMFLGLLIMKMVSAAEYKHFRAGINHIYVAFVLGAAF